MRVTIDLTVEMIAKLETYRAERITKMEGILADCTRKESKRIFSNIITDCRSMAPQDLLFLYLL